MTHHCLGYQNVVDVSNGLGRLLYLSFPTKADKTSFMDIVRRQAQISQHFTKGTVDKLLSFVAELSKAAALVVEPRLAIEQRVRLVACPWLISACSYAS